MVRSLLDLGGAALAVTATRVRSGRPPRGRSGGPAVPAGTVHAV